MPERWQGKEQEVIGQCAHCGMAVTYRTGVILATKEACHDACRQALLERRDDQA